MMDSNLISYEDIYSEIKETLLLSVEDEQARQWYMDAAIASAWSSRQLERQISTLYYERLLASRDQVPVRTETVELTAPLLRKTLSKPHMYWNFLI